MPSTDRVEIIKIILDNCKSKTCRVILALICIFILSFLTYKIYKSGPIQNFFGIEFFPPSEEDTGSQTSTCLIKEDIKETINLLNIQDEELDYDIKLIKSSYLETFIGYLNSDNICDNPGLSKRAREEIAFIKFHFE
ncbi:MAG: hypothetical protein ACRBG0_27375 [Lewinella sp.]|uniref:hypothetical protein n=1 Tax=Lewinella sp. TaxID=2004506 RepID=UPI003D6A05BA